MNTIRNLLQIICLLAGMALFTVQMLGTALQQVAQDRMKLNEKSFQLRALDQEVTQLNGQLRRERFESFIPRARNDSAGEDRVSVVMSQPNRPRLTSTASSADTIVGNLADWLSTNSSSNPIVRAVGSMLLFSLAFLPSACRSNPSSH